MKFISLLLPALVSAAVLDTAAVLEVRQLGGTRSGKSSGAKGLGKASPGGGQGKFGTAKVAGTKKLTPVVNPQATREITRFGPLTVNGVSRHEFFELDFLANKLLSIEESRCQR
jgi:hypothetical protein